MPEVQEEFSEKALRFMIKVPELLGELVVAAARHMMHKLEQREPVGKHTVDKLMQHNNDLKRAEFAGNDDMKNLVRFARKHGVGIAVIQNQDKSYSVYFRTNRAEQMDQCLKDYTKHKFAKKDKEPIAHKVEKAQQHVSQQAVEKPKHQREHKINKEIAR